MNAFILIISNQFLVQDLRNSIKNNNKRINLLISISNVTYGVFRSGHSGTQITRNKKKDGARTLLKDRLQANNLESSSSSVVFINNTFSRLHDRFFKTFIILIGHLLQCLSENGIVVGRS